jgi:hypothetical protein
VRILARGRPFLSRARPGAAFPDLEEFAAARIAIFLASLIAGGLGVMILWSCTQ